jgi:hypothetical protein
MAGPESIDPEPSTGEGLVGRAAIAACLALSGARPSPLDSATIVALSEQRARILKVLAERVDVLRLASLALDFQAILGGWADQRLIWSCWSSRCRRSWRSSGRASGFDDLPHRGGT